MISEDTPIKILISGLGMPGVTSVATVFLTGQPFVNNIYGATMDYQRTNIQVWDKELVVFDLGCQTAFVDRFTGELAKFIFSKTSTLIFVIDALEIKALSRVRHYLEKEVLCLRKYSPTAKAYVFINKIDLIPKKMFEEVIEAIITYLHKKQQDRGITESYRCFPTSCLGTGIFQALDVVLNDLKDRYFPNRSPSSFKQQLWAIR